MTKATASSPATATPSIGATKAYLSIGEHTLEQNVTPEAKEVTFKLQLTAGDTERQAGDMNSADKKVSANYVYVLNMDISTGPIEGWQTRQGQGLPLAEGSTDFPLVKVNKGKAQKH
ncbi:MAG: hypothetical protein ACI9A1_001030 [Lentimonas sp.]|jgi:hypothetical protein